MRARKRERNQEYDWIDEVIFERRIWLIDRACRVETERLNAVLIGAENMTPQEELFKEFFNNEKILVKDMDTLSLRAHREELAKIAFEARARLSAVDDEEKGRKPKKTGSDGKPLPSGFQRSVAGDDTSSEAINTIKDRQKRLTKEEKLLEGLKKLGIDTKEAERIMSSGAILGRLKDKKENGEAKTEEVKPLFNPFEKK